MPDTIKWPSDAVKINKRSRLYAERSQFQNILRAIDGSHIHIIAPKHLHQAYFNRKEFYSVVLLTFCDATVAFYYVWTGNPGGTHDSIMLQHSDLFVHSNERIPPGYCLLGYSGFPLLEWHVTAFNDHGNLKRQQKLFNKTHSRCHYWKAFGVLKNRFRRLYRFEILDLTLIVNKFRAVYVLQNIYISETDGDLPVEPKQPNAA